MKVIKKVIKYILLILILFLIFINLYQKLVWEKENEKRMLIAIGLKNEIEYYYKLNGFYPNNINKLPLKINSEIDFNVFNYRTEYKDQPQNFELIWNKAGLLPWNAMMYINDKSIKSLEYQVISGPDENGFYLIDLH